MSRWHPATRVARAAWPLAAMVLGAILLAQGCSSGERKRRRSQRHRRRRPRAENANDPGHNLRRRNSLSARPGRDCAARRRANQKVLRRTRQQSPRRRNCSLNWKPATWPAPSLKIRADTNRPKPAYNSALQSARQDLNTSKEQLDAAQKLFDAREILYKQGAMAAKDVEDARIALTQARNQYDLARKIVHPESSARPTHRGKGQNDQRRKRS